MMNKFQKTLSAIICGLGISCEERSISGLPIKVSSGYEVYSNFYRGLTVEIEANGRRILACTNIENVYDPLIKTSLSALTFLIQQEIYDGDNELIRVYGKYVGDRFEINKIVLKDYIAIFKRV